MTMLRFHRSGATVARLLPLTALALGLAWTSPAEAQDQPTRAPAPVVRKKAPAQKKASPPAAKTKAPAAAADADAADEAAEAPAEADEPEAAETEAGEVASDDDAAEVDPSAEAPKAEKAPRVVIVHKEVPVEDEAGEAERESAPSEQPSNKTKRDKTKASSRAKHTTAVPAFVLNSSPKPDELEYTEGGEIPPGYEMDTRMRKGLVIGGAVTLGAAWLLSSAAATLLIKKREEDTMGGSFSYRTNHDEGDTPPEAPLYIPLAGPWIALRTMDDLGPEGKAALVADGVVQAAGVAMLIGGLAARQKVLVRTEEATVGVAAGVGSAYMTGSF